MRMGIAAPAFDERFRVLEAVLYGAVARRREVIKDLTHKRPHSGGLAASATLCSKRYMSQKVVVPKGSSPHRPAWFPGGPIFMTWLRREVPLEPLHEGEMISPESRKRVIAAHYGRSPIREARHIRKHRASPAPRRPFRFHRKVPRPRSFRPERLCRRDR